MVARNFSLQDIPYSRLLQIPDDDREYLTLDELKPYHLTELGGVPLEQFNDSQQQQQIFVNQSIQQSQGYVYYDLNSQPVDGSAANTVYDDQGAHLTEQHSVSMDTTYSSKTGHAAVLQKQQIIQAAPSVTDSNYSRKRKYSYNNDGDETDDSKSVRTTDENKKQNHSEIEKRRRDKMNTYITELSSMVPMCHAMSRKLDKLTVLRMAVQHLKTIRGAVHSYTEGHYKPSFLTDQELKQLILQAAEGFLFVVGCDRGKILYVSESVSQTLNYSQSDLLGQSWFDILHPKDVAKVKEQLTSSDLNPRERLIDAKTMLPVKTDVPQGVSRLCPGARRSFFCRMKCKNIVQVKEESEISSGCHRRKKVTDKKFCVIQCTGYLKSWAPAKVGLEEVDGEGDSCNLSCLVAVGRMQPNLFLNINNNSSNLSNNNNTNIVNKYNPNLRNIQFISRHAMDGKFLFVDQKATLVLGFLPQELLGTSMYEYYHQDDLPALADSHKVALQSTDKVTTSIYRLRTKENGFINVQSEWKAFKNPWTKEVEYLIAKNNVILSDLRNFDSNNQCRSGSNYEFYNQTNGMQRMNVINTHVEASKIGRQIAEQIVLDNQRRIGDLSSDSSPDLINNMINENQLSSSMDNNYGRHSEESSSSSHHGNSLPGYSQVRNNVIMSPAHGSLTPEAETLQLLSETSPQAQNDGNDEAAMAVIMSLLEADAGLGGPVDFSGLPWPLP